MKNLILHLITILLILFIYSSEIQLMPNYIERPDKWHLFYPMLSFLFILFVLFLYTIFNSFKEKKFLWRMFIISFSSFYLFLQLNNPKGNSQEIGYVGLITIIIMIIITLYNNKRAKIQKE